MKRPYFRFSTLFTALILSLSHTAYAQDLSIDASISTQTPTIGEAFTVDVTLSYDKGSSAQNQQTTSLNLGPSILGTIETSSDDFSCGSVVVLEPGQNTIACNDITINHGESKSVRLTLTPASNELSQIQFSASTPTFSGETSNENNRWENIIFPTTAVITQTSQTITSSNNIGKIHAVDVSGDDRPDMVVSYLGNLAPQIFLNLGNGTFNTSPITLPGGAINSVTEILSGDIDGDGNLDLLFTYKTVGANAGGIKHFEANSQYVFSQVTGVVTVNPQDIRSAALFDVTGDSIDDLILGNNGQNLIIKNSGSVISQTINDIFQVPGSGETIAIQVGDVLSSSNGNEILFVNANSDSSLRSTGSGDILPANTLLAERYSAVSAVILNHNAFKEVQSALIFDVDRNGSLEVLGLTNGIKSAATQRFGTTPVVYTGRGSSSAAYTSSFASNMIAVDYDKDTVKDVYIQNSNGIGVIYMSKNGTFTPIRTAISAGANFSIAESADLNGDQYPDLMLASTNAGGIKVYLHPGDGTNQISVTTSTTGGGVWAWSALILLLSVLGYRYISRKSD